MPLLCKVADIKYTAVILCEDDYNQVVTSVEDSNNSQGIYGFVHDGELWNNCARVPEGHWAHEILAAHPDAFMIIIKGSPEGVDSLLEQYIAMERDWYNQHTLYDIWQTSLGHVAVC